MAYGNNAAYVNPGSAVQDALEKFMAQRDAEKQLALVNEFKARQQTAVEGQHAQTADFNNRQLEETRRYREMNQGSLDEARAASAAASTAAGAERTAKTAEAAALKQRLEAIVADPKADPNLRRAAQFKLLDITPTADVQTGRDHGAEARDRATTGLTNALTLMAKRDQYGDENRATAKPVHDNPALPNGVKAYADQLVAKHKGNPLAALAEMQTNMGNVRQAHPNVNLADISDYIRKSSLKGDESAPAATVKMKNPSGAIGDVPSDQVPAAEAKGYTRVQ